MSFMSVPRLAVHTAGVRPMSILRNLAYSDWNVLSVEGAK